MPLLLGDDEVEALEAALSYVDALPPTQPDFQAQATSAVAAAPPVNASPDHNASFSPGGEVRLDAELDRLLLETLSSSSEHDSDSTQAVAATSTALTTTSAAPSRHVLPSPLPPMVANVAAPDVSAQNRRGSRAKGSTSTSLAKTKRRVKVNPNRARDERKHELAYLRNKVEQMERELETIHHRRRARGIRCAEPPPTSSSSTSQALTTSCSKPGSSPSRVPFIWRDIATRQQQRREKSERENARLKLVLEGQVKLAKSMETLLQKRARQQVSGCAKVVGASGDLLSQGRTLDFLVDKDTYEALLTSVETAYAELEAVLATNGLLGLDTPCRDARMREGASGMYLDVFANKALPFSYEAVTAAVWNHFKGNEKHRGVVYKNETKHLETSSDTIMEAFTMEFLGKTTTADFRVKQVIRRFVEPDKQVVVWVSIGHARDPNNSPFASFGFVDKGYVVTRRPTSIVPGHDDFTILQMCSLVSPQMAAGCRIDMTAAGDFTEFVLNVMAANTTTSQELIENVLLDQALNKRHVETSLAASDFAWVIARWRPSHHRFVDHTTIRSSKHDDWKSFDSDGSWFLTSTWHFSKCSGGISSMSFLLESEADETLAAALAFLDEQKTPSTLQQQNDANKKLELSDNGHNLPSLNDPEAGDVLDALSVDLPALADKAIKNISWAAAGIPTAKFISHRCFKRHQVVPSSPAQTAALPLPTKATKTPGTTQKKPYVRKKPLGYNPNKARDERKLELIYLRQKVTDMELELQKLQEIKGSRAYPDSESVPGVTISATDLAQSNDSHCTDDDGVPRVWEKMCARQLERRVKAERENARLKVVLEGQIKIAKSMEQILKKRTVLRSMESCGSNKRTKHTNGVPRSPDPRADAKTFEVLLAGVEASYSEVDAVFEANGLGRTEAPKSDAQMRDGVNGMYLEIFANKMLPFGMHATGEAVWQHFKGTDIPYRWYHSKSAGSIESTEDTMVECFGMNMYDAKSKTTAEFNVKQILRRYVEEDRVVIVWRSHIDPLEFSNKRFAGIHFQEKGYVVIKPRAHSCDSADDDDFTLVQTCYIITPDLSDQSLNEDAKTGALTEFVMSSTAANISASNEMIENVLLDQVLQQRKRRQ